MIVHPENREFCHITDLRIGDTVIHNGIPVTVGKENLKHCKFMGTTLHGDSYRAGILPVIRLKTS